MKKTWLKNWKVSKVRKCSPPLKSTCCFVVVIKPFSDMNSGGWLHNWLRSFSGVCLSHISRRFSSQTHLQQHRNLWSCGRTWRIKIRRSHVVVYSTVTPVLVLCHVLVSSMSAEIFVFVLFFQKHHMSSFGHSPEFSLGDWPEKLQRKSGASHLNISVFTCGRIKSAVHVWNRLYGGCVPFSWLLSYHQCLYICWQSADTNLSLQHFFLCGKDGLLRFLRGFQSQVLSGLGGMCRGRSSACCYNIPNFAQTQTSWG